MYENRIVRAMVLIKTVMCSRSVISMDSITIHGQWHKQQVSRWMYMEMDEYIIVRPRDRLAINMIKQIK